MQQQRRRFSSFLSKIFLATKSRCESHYTFLSFFCGVSSTLKLRQLKLISLVRQSQKDFGVQCSQVHLNQTITTNYALSLRSNNNSNIDEIEGFTSMCIQSERRFTLGGWSTASPCCIRTICFVMISLLPFNIKIGKSFVLTPGEPRCNGAHTCTPQRASVQHISKTASYRLHLISILCQNHMRPHKLFMFQFVHSIVVSDVALWHAYDVVRCKRP